MKSATVSLFVQRRSYSRQSVLTGKDVFYRLLHFHEFADNQHVADAFLRYHLDTVERDLQSQFKAYMPTAIASLQVTKHPSGVFSSEEKFHESLRQSAPVILTEPCWLQDVYVAANNQDPLCAALFRIYSNFQSSRHAELYQALLARFGVANPVIYSRAYCRRADSLETFFDFAAVQLALAYQPRSMLAEILGFTLAFCRSSTVAEQYFPGQVQRVEFFSRRRGMLARQEGEIERLIGKYLQDRPEDRERRWRRIQSGFWLYRYLFSQSATQLHAKLTRRPSAARAMLNLLKRKATAAQGHHGRITLGGRSLDDWFQQLSTNGEAFLTALRQSPYVDSDRPEQSRLLSLFNFEGPMFGILEPAEVEVVRNWLAGGALSQPDIAAPVHDRPSEIVLEDKRSVAAPRFNRLSNRRLFYHLINAERYPGVLTCAESKLKRQLAVFKLLAHLPFRTYSHEAFEQYLQTLYRREMAAYRPLTGKPKISRQAYVWGLEQFAPTVLIDGVWLQYCRWLQFRYPEVSAILTGIYADELGNGKLEYSHPTVFRQLMQQLELDLPPVQSRAFSEHRGFVDSAFDLPVFMLTLANYPQRFLPELLGLNMAIELSGLGKTYMSMVDELEYWHIDSTIARLHITIDNFADGHAAKAKQAIQLYLDEVLAAQGEPAMQRHWYRINTGFHALRMISWRFKLAVPTAYMYDKVCRFFRRRVRSQP